MLGTYENLCYKEFGRNFLALDVALVKTCRRNTQGAQQDGLMFDVKVR